MICLYSTYAKNAARLDIPNPSPPSSWSPPLCALLMQEACKAAQSGQYWDIVLKYRTCRDKTENWTFYKDSFLPVQYPILPPPVQVVVEERLVTVVHVQKKITLKNLRKDLYTLQLTEIPS